MATPIVVDANGLRFETLSWGAGDRLALLLHGFPQTALAWRHLGPALAAGGRRVWAPNQRGYGASTRPAQRSAYALPHLLDDVAGLIDAAGAREVTLIGHDWGGIVAWFFAQRRVRPLARLVVINAPHPAAFRAALRRSPRQRLRSWYAAFFQLPRIPEALLGAAGARPLAAALRASGAVGPGFADGAIDAYRRAAAEPGALRAMIDWYRANRGALAAPVRTIDVPTLLLWGTEDVALGIETTFDTQRYVRDLTVRYFAGVSHWVPEAVPERVAAELAAWLPPAV